MSKYSIEELDSVPSRQVRRSVVFCHESDLRDEKKLDRFFIAYSDAVDSRDAMAVSTQYGYRLVTRKSFPALKFNEETCMMESM